MKRVLQMSENSLTLKEVQDFVFGRNSCDSIEISSETEGRIRRAHRNLYALLDQKIPIYGVTTGFGDSSFRFIPPAQSEELQKNLIAYLSCGTGPDLSEPAARATLLIRLKSLCRGYSGVSMELIERMKFFLERGWTPIIPREGSLGASGDLIPLAYIASALQGQGELQIHGRKTLSSEAHSSAKLAPYALKPKEGLALVNGTSAMAGVALVNLTHARYLCDLATLASGWMCLALRGKVEAFGVLVNEKAKNHLGQASVARRIRGILAEEDYQSKRGQDIGVTSAGGAAQHTEEFIQDRYSLRCSPQILGPVLETIDLASDWLETEINSTSDNPLIDDDGTLGMGGNFYGGYLGHGMDYLKISLAHIADLMDRQLTMLIDDKSNRGLTPNLADWPNIPESERFLHHGLKGLHQAVNAITSEVLAKSMPNTVFSRSSESHNQDKVSLGMSAAVQCSEMVETLYSILTMHLICLAQALDLREITVQGATSEKIYTLIRQTVPRISKDTALGQGIRALSDQFKTLAMKQGEIFDGHHQA